MSLRHQALLAASLRKLGYKVLYVERAAGGTVATGKTILEGDFAGCVRVDLEEAVKRFERRYKAISEVQMGV